MTEANEDNAGVVVIPPVMFLGALVLGFLIDWLWPVALLPGNGQYIAGGIMIAAALVFGIWGRILFSRFGTNVEPFKPTTLIITSGPFAYSRNPLYLSLFVLYAGIGILADNVWLFVLALPVFFIVRYGVIAREERYLERKFGETYLSYKRRVRRWL